MQTNLIIAAQRIALRYIAEKINEAQDEARQPEGMEAESYECFNGWFQEYEDFEDWAMLQGYGESAIEPAWEAIQVLLKGR